MLCGGGSLVHENPQAGVALVLRCRSWRCPDCQPVRRALVIDQAQSGDANRFVTLTVNPSCFSDPVERAEKLAAAWRIVVKRYKRAFQPREFEYYAVFEATKRGEPHLHILIRGPWIDQKWLSEQMNELIGAPIVDVRKVQNRKHLSWYLSKYVGKDLHKFGSCKRYWRTKNYVKKENLKHESPWKGCVWKRTDELLQDVEGRWKFREGRNVFWLSPGCIVAEQHLSRYAVERTRAPPGGIC